MTTTTTCHSDVVKLLTHLSAVQTGGQTLWLTARSPLRPRSPSWCCPCTSPPPTCTGRPHWTELKSKDKLVAKKSHWSITSCIKKTPVGRGCWWLCAPLTDYEAHPGRVAEEEAFVQDLLTIRHVNPNQGGNDARQVHLDVSHPQRCVWALQHLFKVHTLKHTRGKSFSASSMWF